MCSAAGNFGFVHDLTEHEHDLKDGRPINPPFNPRLFALPLAPSSDPWYGTPSNKPAPPSKLGCGPDKNPRMTAERKADASMAAMGAAEHEGDSADTVVANGEAVRPAEIPKP